jgi:hypothetical protein
LVKNRIINYSGTDGTINLTGKAANDSILSDIDTAIGNKRVLEVVEDVTSPQKIAQLKLENSDF